MEKGICDICGKETKVGKFYWGFFKSEYESEKWLMACDECRNNFLKASNEYWFNREPLIELENKCKNARQRRR